MELRRLQLRRGQPEQAPLAPPLENSVKGIDLMRVHQCEEIGETGGPTAAGATTPAGAVGSLVNVSVEQDAKAVDEVVPVKRRRGRPPRGQAKTPPQPRLPPPPPPPPPPPRKEDEEEDVCFICFDGGSLVLCDRRGCPKAYHPACIKRDEAFFQTKAKWNCGWHICSRCQRASSYMCFTCTYSVCKKCIKDADYVSVRENMGFCATCMKTIMLIENVAQDDKEMIQVDFDDKTSWEYLFKVYWLCLKEKLSLTIDELTEAKNPWKEVCHMATKLESRHGLPDRSYTRAFSSDNSCKDIAVNGTKRRRTNDPATLSNKLDAKSPGNHQEMPPECTNWATKELLEFVSYMKNGDTSMLSQFDVQALLLDYIKMKNLRDPRQKSQVICDLMLVKLFGKQRVGHFEMLKLLESHFLIQENSSNAKTLNGETTPAVPCQMEDELVYDNVGSDKRRKTRKKADSRGPNANLDEYAAIDVHNINLIYLRRNFLETLLDDINKVQEKVVGTIVRIRVSGSDQKLDIHRLVQVVGTCKAKESYQIGPKTMDVMLEILNLDKREVISIDEISDQDVTEDECKRLRQSIKCGLNKRLTVGEILEKSATLQAMRVGHVLEAEILKLNHLRDRASEKGHRKELRECVEKLEILKSPEERQRRMQETPEIHTDPSMDPSLASAEDAELVTRKHDNHIKAQSSSLCRPQNKGDILNSLGNSAQKNFAAAFLRSRNVCTTFYTDNDGSSKVHDSSDQEPIKDVEESEIWHYQDPTGKIQGPFSMSQLRRWKSSGHFPPYLRIWKTHEKQDQSVLLTDALQGRFHNASTSQNDNSPSQELRLALNDARETGNDASADSDKGKDVLLKNPVANNSSSTSSGYAVPATVENSNEGQVESLVSGFGKLEGDNSFHFQPQVSCPQSSPVIPENTIAHEARETPGTDRWNAVQTDGGDHSSVKNVVDRTTNAGSVSLNESLGAPNLNQEIHFLDLSSSTPKSSPEDLETQAAETIQSLASCVLVKGTSGVTWSTTTSSVVVGAEQQLPGVTPQNGDGVVIAAPSEKPVELTADHVATQTPDNPQVAHSTGWPAIVADPDECDESVSDLLAEVEAMESMNGPPSSPTSTFHCDDDDDLTKGSENVCFNPVARITLAPETCRSDGSHANNILDTENVPGRRNSPASEVKENAKTIDASANQCGAGPELPLFASPAPTSEDLTLTTTALRLGSEAAESNLEAGPVEGNSKAVLSGLFSEPSPKSGHGSARGNVSMGSGNVVVGHRSPRGSQQQRYGGGDRSTSHRDRDIQGRDSGFGREKQWWNNGSINHNHGNSNNHTNRQGPSYSSGHGHHGHHGHGHGHGSGSYPNHPPKGLRICKFYESGYCKKGASCSFWHP